MLPSIEWRELWQYIPKTTTTKRKTTYEPIKFMTSTTVNNIKLTSIYNTYYNFMNSDRKKSIDLLKQTKHDCHNCLSILADDVNENLQTVLPNLTPTQRHFFIAWLDSVSLTTDDKNLKWRNMSKREGLALYAYKKLEKKTSKIYERTEENYKFSYDADSVKSILEDAHIATESLKTIQHFLEKNSLNRLQLQQLLSINA